MGERDERKVIGAELRRKRRALQWTQEELAVRAGTVRETIMRVERGDPSVKPVTLDDVRHAFDAAAVAPDINVRLPGARKPRAEKDFAAVHAELARVSREYRRLRADVYRTGTAIFKIIGVVSRRASAISRCDSATSTALVMSASSALFSRSIAASNTSPVRRSSMCVY